MKMHKHDADVEAEGRYRELLRTDLYSFSVRCFKELYPNTAFVDNWSVRAIVHELEQVYAGQEKRLIINLPPRALKSLLVSIAFPAFLLGTRPSTQIVCASYAQDFADKLSRQFRQVVESDWFGQTFPDLQFTRNATGETVTTLNGYRLATSINGILTGIGADIVIVDDPINAIGAQSDTERNNVNDWFDNSLSTRLNEKKTGPIVLVMQRLHEEDLSGYLLEKGGWDLLSLPAIAPEDRIVQLTHGQRHVWKEGEPLDPARLDLATLQQEKARIGTYTFATQYLQDPVPRDGTIIKIEWLRHSPAQPVPAPGSQIVQSWDTGFKTNEGSSHTVCETFLVQNDDEAHLIDVQRHKFEFPELVQFFIAHTRKSKPKVILVEDKGSGQSLIQSVRHERLPTILARKPEGDKKARMIFETPKLEQKCLFIPKWAPWTEAFLQECRAFPKGRFNDQIDALSQFLNWWRTRSKFEFDFDNGRDAQTSYDVYGGSVGAPSAETIADLMYMSKPWR